MLTPIEIQSKTFKTGFGYDKKEVEAFIKDVVKDYEVLYKDNIELNDKINVLSEGVQYYKSIEKTLQKALVLAQKAAQETEANATAKAENIVATATNRAATIEEDAHQKAAKIKSTAQDHADTLLTRAREELEHIQIDVANLLQQYDKYKIQYAQLINTQKEILESPAYNVDYSNFLTFHSFISSKVEMPKVEKECGEELVKEAIEVEAKPEEKAEPVKVEEAVVEPVKKEVTAAEPVQETSKPEEDAKSMDTMDFMPEINLDGILDDPDLEAQSEEQDTSIGDHTMKELTATTDDASDKKEPSLEDTLNQLSEKELLMKLFASANESELKTKKADKKDDFEFLDL
ncbi:MAG: DivIVA domain-containing protein [bacterium]|nr:DivIVA domain-containing protein [bacterium]